jgi:hypothetical protein
MRASSVCTRACRCTCRRVRATAGVCARERASGRNCVNGFGGPRRAGGRMCARAKRFVFCNTRVCDEGGTIKSTFLCDSASTRTSSNLRDARYMAHGACCLLHACLHALIGNGSSLLRNGREARRAAAPPRPAVHGGCAAPSASQARGQLGPATSASRWLSAPHTVASTRASPCHVGW